MKTKILFGSAIVVISMVTLSGVLKYSSYKDEATNSDIVEASESQIYHAEIGEWVSEMNILLSEPLNDPKLKKANNDEGFEYYLKSLVVDRKSTIDLIKGNKELEEDYINLFLLTSYISNKQAARTVHLDPNGEAIESTDLVNQWAPTDENTHKAFEYVKQIMNDLDVAINHNGKGEIYGVTHLLNGDKASEVKKFVTSS
ncbi:hypothetical protein B857_03748 [Solibacillus isronensis B3W22]|uniref:Uncharacterized protein n=1 Tax=Solibacillus isronensis B3W22 TaxID=1224748 RepID=K1KU54_9BACL|nr:hypothetical protein [Solibacillus isronensis]AMO85502.1 hypothetical protein SOLI23_07865 [Solibacillus silvestris]EKB43432.1 hypothetical protein B857_03748 [Solibacillus isronensis B3W22]